MSDNKEASIKNILAGGSRAVNLDWEDSSKHGIETYTLALLSDRLHDLEDKSKKELDQLKERQQKVAYLQKMLKAINAATDSKGNVDFSKQPEMQEMFVKAKELGAMIDETKLTYTTEERERLLENIRLTNEDLTVQNEMQLQVVTRLTNERYEAYQMARAIMKPLHDDKINKARAISGK